MEKQEAKTKVIAKLVAFQEKVERLPERLHVRHRGRVAFQEKVESIDEVHRELLDEEPLHFKRRLKVRRR